MYMAIVQSLSPKGIGCSEKSNENWVHYSELWSNLGYNSKKMIEDLMFKEHKSHLDYLGTGWEKKMFQGKTVYVVSLSYFPSPLPWHTKTRAHKHIKHFVGTGIWEAVKWCWNKERLPEGLLVLLLKPSQLKQTSSDYTMGFLLENFTDLEISNSPIVQRTPIVNNLW